MDWMMRAGYAKHDYIYSTFSKIWMEPRRVEYVACKRIIELKPIWGGTPNHPKLDNFSIETHGFGGFPILGNLMKPQFVRDTLW